MVDTDIVTDDDKNYLNDKHPLRQENGQTSVFPVLLGNFNFAENQLSHPHGTQPNPLKISWSRTNNVKVHEIPNPKHKTIRTSGEVLYRISMNFKTFRVTKFNDMLRLCNMCGPHYFESGLLEPMWVYITDHSFDQEAGYDDDYITWNITLQEAND
ncbi:MAG: hypothetical protein WC248_02285 [Candidatus Methanomethylophilaceae archaeon]|jgi:hypothetical protein